MKLEDISSVYDTFPVAVLIADRGLRITGCNKRCIDLISAKNREDITGLSLTNLISGIEDHLTTGEPVICALKYGENTIPVEISFSPGPGDTVICVLHDASQLTLATEALSKATKQLEESQRLAGLGHWELDIINNRLYWSDEVYRIFGLEPREFGATQEAFFEMVHPDDREMVSRTYGDSLSNMAPYEIEHRIVLRDGTIKHVHERCHTEYDESGRPTRSIGTVLDITERKSAEEARLLIETKYRLIADSLREVIWQTDRELNFTYISPGIRELLGYEPDIMIGNPVWEFLPPDAIPWFREIVLPRQDEVRAGAKVSPITSEVRYTGRDGTDVWVEISSVPLYLPDGRFTGFQGMVRDVTERKQIIEELRQSKSMYEFMINNVGDVVWEMDRELNFVYTSPVVEKLFGYTQAEIKGRSFWEFLPPESYRLIKKYYKLWLSRKKMVRNISIPPVELQNTDKSGRPLWVEATISPIYNDNDELTGFHGVTRVIEQRKQAETALLKSEQLYKALVATSPDGVGMTDLAGNYLYVSDNYLKMYGYQERDELRGKNILNVIAPEDREKAVRQLRAVVGGLSGGPTEFRHVRQNGAIFWAETNAQVLRDPVSGESYGIICTNRDVSARKEAENLLRAERDKAQRYLDIAGVILVAVDKDQLITMINKKGCEILGRREEELIGQNWFDTCIPEQEREAMVMMFASAVAADGRELPGYYENHIVTHNGEEKLIAWRNTTLRDESGQVSGTLSSGEDITEKHRVGEILAVSEQKFRVMFERHNAPMLLIEPDTGVIIDANLSAAEFYGYPREKLSSMNISGINQLSPEQIAAERQRAKEESTNYFVFPHRLSDGSTRIVEVHSSPVSVGDRILLFSIIHDITERKRAEEKLTESEARYRIISENTDDVIWILSLETGKFTYISPSVSKLRGYSPDEILGQSLEDVLTPQSYKVTIESLQQRIAAVAAGDTAQRTLIHEVDQPHKNGSVIPTEVVTTILTNPAGQPDKILGITRNITERKRAEKQILGYIDKLKELNTTKDKLFSILAHDLRSPVGALTDCSSIITRSLEYNDRQTLSEYAPIMNVTALKVSRLLENLLDWALSQSQGIQFNPAGIELKPVVSGIIELFRPTLQKKNISVSIEIPADIVISADMNMLKTILRNLISNAVKFSPHDGRVRLTGRLTGDYILISVADSGKGVPADYVDRLFRIDYKITAHGTDSEQGSGLGLVLCKEFVEMQGGKIWIENPGQSGGSRFSFTLPVYHV